MDGHIEHYRLVLPCIIALLQIFLKFFISREPEKKHFEELACEFPVNVMFLALAFSLILIFTYEKTNGISICLMLACLICIIIGLAIDKKCKKLIAEKLTRQQPWTFYGLLTLSYILSFLVVSYFGVEVMQKEGIAEEQSKSPIEMLQIQKETVDSIRSIQSVPQTLELRESGNNIKQKDSITGNKKPTN